MTAKLTLAISIYQVDENLTIEAVGPGIYVKPEPFVLDPLFEHSITLNSLVRWPAFVKLPRLKALGQALYETLFTENIQSAFDFLKSRRKDSRDAVCIRIQTDLPDIVSLPWELLHDGIDFLATNPSFSIIRDTGRLNNPLTHVRGPLKILYACASDENDPDSIPLHLKDSIERLQNALARSKNRVQLEVVEHTTPAILESKILEDYHVICFAGHATERCIYLEDGRGGHVEYGPKTLAGKIKGRQTRLLFLAACNTATYYYEAGINQPGFALTLAAQASIPAVIGMQYAVEDIGATLLTVRYFEALANRLPVDEALAEARKAVFDFEDERDIRRDVFSPVLFLQTESSHLFRPERNRLALILLFPLLILLLLIPWLYGSLQKESRERELSEVSRTLAESTAEAEFATRQSAEEAARLELEKRAQAEAESVSVDLAKQSTEGLSRNDPRASLGAAIQAVEATYSASGTFTGAAESALYESLMNNGMPFYRVSSRTGQYPIPLVEVSPDGHMFLATRGKDVGLWDTSGELIVALDGIFGASLRSADFAENAPIFITRELLNTHIQVWNTDGQLLNEFCTDVVMNCESNDYRFGVDDSVISPDGNLIATVHYNLVSEGVENDAVRIWNSSGQFITALRGHTGSIVGVQFSPNNAYILTSSRDGTARLWDLDGSQLQRFRHRVSGAYMETIAAGFSHNGDFVVTLDADNDAIMVWDLSGNLHRKLTINKPIRSVIADPLGNYILAVTDTTEEDSVRQPPSSGKDIIVVDEGGVRFLKSDNTPFVVLEGHNAKAVDIVSSPTDNRFVTFANPYANESDGSVLYWNDDGELLGAFDGLPSIATPVSFSADGTRILTTNDGKIRLWDDNGSLIATLGEVEAEIINTHGALWAAFDVTGEYILVHRYVRDSALYGSRMSLWDRDGNLASLLIEKLDGINSIDVEALTGAFSPDGEYVATIGCKETEPVGCRFSIVRLWDMQGNLLATLDRHKYTIFDIIFSPDGRLILTRADEGETMLWDLAGNLIAELHGHQDPLADWVFSPLSQAFVTMSTDYLNGNTDAFLWDSEGKLITRLQGRTFQFNSDGTRLIAADNDTVYLYSQSGRSIARYAGLTGIKYSFSSVADRLITVRGSGTDAQLWDMDGNLLAVLGGHDSTIETIAFSPDGTLILTGDAYTGRLWDVNGTLIAQLYSKVESVSFSRDGSRLLTSAGGDARLWSKTGELLSVFIPAGNQSISAAYFIRDETRVLASMDDGTVGIWAIKEPIAMAQEGTNIAPVASNEQFNVLLWDSDGNLLTTIGTEQRIKSARIHPKGDSILTIHDEFLDLWGLDGRHLSRFVSAAETSGYYPSFVDATFSPGGNLLISTNRYNVFLWNINGPKLAELNQHSISIHSSIIAGNTQAGSNVTQAIFAQDSEYILTANQDWTAQLWDINGDEIKLLEGHRQPIHSVARSPDDKLIVTADQGGVARLWNADGTLVATLQGHTDNITKVEFSVDGTRILTVSDDATARLWDLLGNPIATLGGYINVGMSQLMGGFSPDGKFVVTAGCVKSDPVQRTDCLTSMVRIWDVEGRLIKEVPTHDDDNKATDHRIRNLIFNPVRAEFLVVVNGVRYVWSYAGDLLFSVAGDNPWSEITEFSSDGELLLTAGSYLNDGALIGTATVWDNSGQEVSRIDLMRDDTEIISAHFCPDSTCLVTSHVDGIPRLWSIDGDLTVSLEVGKGGIRDTVFDTYGNRMASMSTDGTVYLWGKGGKLLLELKGHKKIVTHAIFNAIDSRLVTIDEEGRAFLWEIYPDMDAMLVEARRRLSSFIPDYSECFTDNTREWMPECAQAEYDACLVYLDESSCGELPDWD